MKSAKTLMVMMANIAPEEMLIEQLESALEEYKNKLLITSSEKEKEKLFHDLAFPCILILSKINGQGRDVLEMLEEMEQLENTRKAITPQKQ